ncbi:MULTISPECIES: EF-hand domain-containing protein [Pantoea]|uniref:EF-hand domain-containing protein n=1 Tax=Pantoea TaxID=53335 RepID=UPI00197FC04C|nr:MULTISPECIES: EF-hand domain-containing protein [Pantoea]
MKSFLELVADLFFTNVAAAAPANISAQRMQNRFCTSVLNLDGKLRMVEEQVGMPCVDQRFSETARNAYTAALPLSPFMATKEKQPHETIVHEYA